MKIKNIIWTLLFAAVGFLFRFMVSGHDFIGYIFFGVAALIILFSIAKRTLKRIICVILIIGIAVFAVFEIPIIKASLGDEENKADYLIILGAGVNGYAPSRSLMDRIEAAEEYLKEHPDTVAIASGGKGGGESISEAECIKNVLVSKGIAEKRIILEDKATTTYENLEYSFAIIDRISDKADPKIAILSSEYHIYRAEQTANELGRDVLTVPAHTYYPSVMLNYCIREAFGVAYYALLK